MNRQIEDKKYLDEKYSQELQVYIENLKHQLQKDMEIYKDSFNTKASVKRLHDEEYLILLRSVIDYAQIAVRTIVLANGAGATAVIAFIGNTIKHNQSTYETVQLGISAAIFATGVGLGVLATVFAYLSNWNMAKKHSILGTPAEYGSRWERIAGLICIILGLISFIIGVLFCIFAYTNN